MFSRWHDCRASVVGHHPTCSHLTAASNLQTFDINTLCTSDESFIFLKTKVSWDQIHCFGCSLCTQINYFIPFCLCCCRLKGVKRVNLSLSLLSLSHHSILKLSSICDDVILRIRRVVVSIHNARHDTYCIVVGRGEEHYNEKKIDAVYLIYSHSNTKNNSTSYTPSPLVLSLLPAWFQRRLNCEFQPGTTQYYCVLLPMLRNDFKIQQQQQSRGRIWACPDLWQVWRHEFIEVPLLLRKLPLRHSAALSRRLSAVTPSSLHGTKNACCQSRQSEVASSKLTVRETIHTNTPEDIVACGWLP